MKSVLSGVVLGLALLLLPSCSSRQTLPALMVERLDWMDEVAEAKRAKGLPITDPVREAELLRTMTQRGVAAGLPAESVRLFFTGQVQAAKVAQEEWLRKNPTATTRKVPDLTGSVRPALDKIGRQMIAGLAQPRSAVEKAAVVSHAARRLARAGYSEAVIQPAIIGLKAGVQDEEAPTKP